MEVPPGEESSPPPCRALFVSSIILIGRVLCKVTPAMPTWGLSPEAQATPPWCPPPSYVCSCFRVGASLHSGLCSHASLPYPAPGISAVVLCHKNTLPPPPQPQAGGNQPNIINNNNNNNDNGNNHNNNGEGAAFTTVRSHPAATIAIGRIGASAANGAIGGIAAIGAATTSPPR